MKRTTCCKSIVICRIAGTAVNGEFNQAKSVEIFGNHHLRGGGDHLRIVPERPATEGPENNGLRSIRRRDI